MLGAGCTGELSPTSREPGASSDDLEVRSDFRGSYGPDLYIDSIQAPPSTTPGGPLTVDVRICNDGPDPASGFDVTLYLSDDAILEPQSSPMPPFDPFVGSTIAGTIYGHQCRTERIEGLASVPADGAYFVIGGIDEWNSVAESDETNNVFVGGRIGVGFGPDLVISSIESPPSAMPGADTRVQVTVCNQGTDRAGNVEVSAYLSADETIRGIADGGPNADPLLGQMTSFGLEAGRCQTETIQGFASVPQDGAYHVGAIVDEWQTEPELQETNNVRVGDRIGVGFGADLVVTSIEAPASVQAGDAFEPQVTVCNVGTQYAGSVEVSIYLSVDEVIDGLGGPNPAPSPDPQVGQAYFGGMEAGACLTEVVYGYASVIQPGPHFLGAIVDEFNSERELIEDNNTTVGDLMGIGLGPDLVVTAIEAPPSARPSDAFDVDVTVCNQGTDRASGFELGVYLSEDDTFNGIYSNVHFMDPSTGQRWIDPLEAGVCRTERISGFANVLQNVPHYVVAAVDESQSLPELLENNNVRFGPLVGIGSAPDLVVRLFGPPSVRPGDGFEVAVEVCNQGTDPASFAEVMIYLSTDEFIEGHTVGPFGDAFVGQASLTALDAGACRVETVTGYASVTDSVPHFLGALVDEWESVSELIETNNSFVGERIGVGHGPDLRVDELAFPPSARSGDAFNVDVTVCNDGTDDTPYAEVSVYLSENPSIDGVFGRNPVRTPDTLVGQGQVRDLYAGRCRVVTVPGWAAVALPGAHFVGAWVDESDATIELIEDNNTLLGGRTGIGSGPDLVVSELQTPPSTTPGGALDVVATVCNQGTEPAYSADLSIYLSDDARIEGIGTGPSHKGDVLTGQTQVGFIASGACKAVSVAGFAHGPLVGAAYAGAIVDEFDSEPELREDNNTFVGNQVGIGHGPDLIVSVIEAPPSAEPGAPIDVTVTICNQGTDRTAYADVSVYLSTDLRWVGVGSGATDMDPMVGQASVQNLEPGRCRSQTVSGFASVFDPVPHRWVAVVDEFDAVPELMETNNVTFGEAIGVGRNPDLVIRGLRSAPSARPGDALDVEVEICNQGTDPAGYAEVTVYLSEDDQLEGTFQGRPPYTDFLVGQASVSSIEANRCAWVDVVGQASVAQPGVYFIGGIVDEMESTLELLEDNNVFVGDRVGVGNDPDLVIDSIVAPPSVRQGDAFNVDVTVCNQGTETAYTTEIVVLLSEDETIVSSPSHPNPDQMDFRVGQTTLRDPLPASGCRTETVLGYASTDFDGPHFVAAIADEFDSQPELREDNNLRVGATVAVGSGPDLMVTAFQPRTARLGSRLRTQITLCNQGTDPAPSSEVQLDLALDPSGFDEPGAFQGVRSFPALAAGTCATRSLNPVIALAEEGIYNARLTVDPHESIADLNRANNVFIDGRVGIGDAPNLQIVDVMGPASVRPGDPLQVEVRVCNYGTASASATDLSVYLVGSADGLPQPGTFPRPPAVAQTAVPSLRPNRCIVSALSGYANVVDEGVYRAGAVVDEFNGVSELFEDDNGFVSTEVTAVGDDADLVVTQISSPDPASMSESFQVDVTVCNQGTDAASYVEVAVYLSEDEVIDGNVSPYAPYDIFVGQASSPQALMPGACRTETILGWASVSDPGVWFVGAVVDQFDQEIELREDNNVRVEGPISIEW